LPDTDLASSSLVVAAVVTFPLTVSARTDPWTFRTVTSPDTDLASTDTPAGTMIV
jgi:hypothetical protein